MSRKGIIKHMLLHDVERKTPPVSYTEWLIRFNMNLMSAHIEDHNCHEVNHTHNNPDWSKPL